MKTKPLFTRYTWLAMMLSIGCLNLQPAIAVPLDLSDTPLFLLTSTKPNVFFLFDDSGSMDSEIITNSTESNNNMGYIFKLTNGGNTTNYWYIFDHENGYNIQVGNSANDTVDSNNSYVAPTPEMIAASSASSVSTLSKAWKARSSSYNKLYYDTENTYKAWPGFPDAVDTNSSFYSVNYETAAYKDPRRTGITNPTVNLTANITLHAPIPGVTAPALHTISYYPATYWYWVDANNDLTIDDNEGVKVEIKSTTQQCGTGTAGPKPTTAVPCTKRAYADEINNFANWFSYHRKRLFAAKSAVAQSINSAFAGTANMGMATINNPDTSSTDLNLITRRTLLPMNVQANKNSLLRSLLNNTRTHGSTPNRTALDKAGKYYACETSFWSSAVCAITGMTSSTTSTPGTEGACQQNYTVLITDGEYNDSFSFDNEDSATSTTDTVFDGIPYADTDSNTLADIAMYYYERDLSSGTGGLANNVTTNCGVDENSAQHMGFYGITFGIDGNLNWDTLLKTYPRPRILASCGGPESPSSSPTWPSDPSSGTAADRIDDLMHAAYNGRGSYISAKSSNDLAKGVEGTLNNIASLRGAASAVGLNSTSNTGNTRAYISSFSSGSWYGELSAYVLNTNGSIPTTLTPATNPWNAHLWLDGLPDATNPLGTVDTDRVISDRAIITFDPAATTLPYAASFVWANLANTQRDDLRTSGTGTLETDTIAKQRLNYIRGDHRCENGFTSTTTQYCNNPVPASDTRYFRTRIKGVNTFFRTGDFVNSSPIYVGTAVGNYPFATYQDFKDGVTSASTAFSTAGKTTKTRTPMIYVGGNDGMLHAFNATDGHEVFAYIPNSLYNTTTSAGLHKLTEQGGHISYVDQTPAIADALVETPADNTKKWRTILVGALRHGGKGVFALDVTDPDHIIGGSNGAGREAYAASHVMWEYPSPTTTDNNLGYTYSQPVIVPLQTGTLTTDIEWFAVFGNGYNSTNGHAVLYLLKLSGPGPDRTWNSGSDIYTIDTGVGTPTEPNGLSSPALIDKDGDGVYDYAYAGDLYGNMWAFSLKGTNPATDWGVAYKSGTTPVPLFKQDNDPLYALGKTKPITAKPVIINNTADKNLTNPPNVIVLFGTGRYLASGDQIITTPLQSFYGVWDSGTGSRQPSNLVQQVLSTSGNTRTLVTTPATPVIYSSTVSGWYMDLPEAGERSVTKPTLLGTLLLFPTITPTNAPCGGGGTSWLMAVSPFDGHAPGIPTFDVDGNGFITAAENDLGGNYIAAIRDVNMTPEYAFVSGPQTPPGGTSPCAQGSFAQGVGTTTIAGNTSHGLCAPPPPPGRTGRYSWRQLGF
jgi:type IV pilus assembly protein PilY1